jgi:tripartite-type tricarboxylate transporter receptor subunit TctC
LSGVFGQSVILAHFRLRQKSDSPFGKPARINARMHYTKANRRHAMRTAFVVALAVMALASLPAAAQAQAYPAQSLKLITPYAPGSGADALSRVFATELSTQLGKSMVVENKAGMGGSLGLVDVARAAPDGYTLGIGTAPNLVTNAALYGKLGYDPIKDFTYVGIVASLQNALVLRAENPANNVADLLAAIKAKPRNTFTYSSSGSGSSLHLAGVAFGQASGTELVHVPYKGAPDALVGVFSGDVDMSFQNIPVVVSHIRSGKLKALAVTGLMRSAAIPNVPTLDEIAFKGLDVTTWFGFILPAGAPPAVVARLHDALNKSLMVPSLREKLIGQGFELVSAPLEPPAAFVAKVRQETAKWVPIIKASGAKVD